VQSIAKTVNENFKYIGLYNVQCPTCLEQFKRGEKLSGFRNAAVDIEPVELCRIIRFFVQLHLGIHRTAPEKLRLTLDTKYTQLLSCNKLRGMDGFALLVDRAALLNDRSLAPSSADRAT